MSSDDLNIKAKFHTNGELMYHNERLKKEFTQKRSLNAY